MELIQLVQPVSGPSSREVNLEKGSRRGPPASLCCGSVVHCKAPKVSAMGYDIAERQLLDEETDFICKQGKIGVVHSVSDHSVQIDVLITQAEYDTIYDRTARHASNSNGHTVPPSDGEKETEKDVSDLGSATIDEIVQMRKTLPYNYVRSVATTIEEERLGLLQSYFESEEWGLVNEHASRMIADLEQWEGIEVSDTCVSRGLRSGELKDVDSPELVNIPSALRRCGQNNITAGSFFEQYFAKLRNTAVNQLLSSLYLHLSCAHMKLGGFSVARSSGRKAVLLSPGDIRGYAAAISGCHAMGDSTEAASLVQAALDTCDERSLEDDWFSSVRLLEEVYRAYTPKLHPKRLKANTGLHSVEVTVPPASQGEKYPPWLALTTLREFERGEVIFQEAPSIVLPFSTVLQPTSTTSRRVQGDGSRSPQGFSPQRSISEVFSPGDPIRCCDLCGFVIVNHKEVREALELAGLDSIATAFHAHYPIRKPVQCRSNCRFRIYCSAVCEDRAWKSFHRIECTVGGLMSSEQQSTLRIAGVGSSTLMDASIKLFHRICMIILSRAEAAFAAGGISFDDPAAPSLARKSALEVLGELPIVLQLAAPKSAPPAVSTVVQVLRVVSPLFNLVMTQVEPITTKIYQHCLLTHKVVVRCPITQTLPARPQQDAVDAIFSQFECRQLCLFPVIGHAPSAEQKNLAALNSILPAPERELQGASLFDVCGFGAAGELSLTSEPGSEEDGEDLSNALILTTPGDIAGGSFSLCCHKDHGVKIHHELEVADIRF